MYESMFIQYNVRVYETRSKVVLRLFASFIVEPSDNKGNEYRTYNLKQRYRLSSTFTSVEIYRISILALVIFQGSVSEY